MVVGIFEAMLQIMTEQFLGSGCTARMSEGLMSKVNEVSSIWELNIAPIGLLCGLLCCDTDTYAQCSCISNILLNTTGTQTKLLVHNAFISITQQNILYDDVKMHRSMYCNNCRIRLMLCITKVYTDIIHGHNYHMSCNSNSNWAATTIFTYHKHSTRRLDHKINNHKFFSAHTVGIPELDLQTLDLALMVFALLLFC